MISKKLMVMMISMVGAVACFSVGLSAYTKVSMDPNAVETHSYDAVDDGETVTVSFKYFAFTGYTEGDVVNNVAEDFSYDKTYDASTNQSQSLPLSFSSSFEGVSYSKTITANLSSNSTANISGLTAGTKIGSSTVGGIEYTLFASTTFTLTRTSSTSCNTTKYTYQVKGSYHWEYESAQIIPTGSAYGSAVMKTISVPKGSKLSESMARRLFEDEGANGYGYYGVFTDENLSSRYSFSTVLNSNKTLYAGFYKNTYDAVDYLGKILHNKTSNSAVYAEAAGTMNPKNDPSWFSTTKTLSLYNGGNDIVIPAGAKVTFGLNDGSEKKLWGDAQNTKMDGQETYRCFTVSLAEDIDLRGTISIGGTLGQKSSSSNEQGNITTYHVVLDLNGHTITCSSTAKILSYGIIIDSKGTGKILMNGACSILTPAIVYEYHGGNATSNTVNSYTTFPFQWYNAPYLRCRVEMRHINGSWGSVSGYLAIKTSGYSESTPELHILGGNSDYLFVISGNDPEAYVEYEGIQSSAILDALEGTDTACVSRRSRITFHHISHSEFGYLSLSVGTTVNTQDYLFPISPFFNIRFEDSNFYLNKSMVLLPGCSFFGDADSEMHFETTTYSNKQLAGGFFCFERSHVFYDDRISPKVGDPIKDAGFSADVGTTSTKAPNSVQLARYYGKATATFLGKTYFKTGNTSPYVFSGVVNLHNVGWDDGGENPLHESSETSLAAQLIDVKSHGAVLQTYGYSFMLGYKDSSDYCQEIMSTSMPLIAFDEAFVIDSSRSLHGHFDDTKGIFYEHLESGAWQAYILKSTATKKFQANNLTPTAVDVIEGSADSYYQYVVNASGETYYYFSGVYLPPSTSKATPTNSNGTYTITLNTSRFLKNGTTTNVKWKNASASHPKSGYWAKA